MEKPSRKKRRSDLRVSLGRKSVGDLAASEQASTSTNDSSCHLNPDSAIIDPDFAANPDWYLHLPNNSVLASQNSINQAVLNERDANIVNNSNVEELNLSSFDKRQINKILNSSVVVNKAEIEQLMKRKHAMPPDDAEMSEDDTVSIEIQQRRPTTLKRGVPKGGGESVEAYNAFQAITNHKSDSEEESVAAKKKTKRSSTASRKSKLHSDSDISIEIPRKRPAFLKRRPKGAAANDEVDKELDDAFKKALEQTADSEDSEISKKILVPPSSEARERSKLLESSAHDDVSVEIPRRRPAFLKRGSRPARTSQDAYDAFKNITSGSEEEEEDVEDAIGAKDNAPDSSQPKASAHNDVSVEIPQRRPAFLKKGSRRTNTTLDAYNAFKNISSGSEEETESAKNNQSNHSKSCDVSIEIPQRRPAFLKKGSRPARTSFDAYNAFKNVSSGSEETESVKENVPSVSKPSSENEGDVSLPLGAEAINFINVPEDIPRNKKRFSLKKLHSGNQVDLLSQVIEEDLIKDSQSSLRPSHDSHSRLKSPDLGNTSKVTSIASVTANIRSAPLRVSHGALRDSYFPEEINASHSLKEIHVPDVVGQLSKLSDIGSIPGPRLDQSTKSGTSMRNIVQSPAAEMVQSSFKSGSNNMSLPGVQNVLRSPLASNVPLASRLVSESSRRSSVKDVKSQQSLDHRSNASESDGAVSNISNASTVSLPTNLTFGTSVLPLHTNVGSKSSSTTAHEALTETGCTDVFSEERLISKNESKVSGRSLSQAESDSVIVALPEGSDSVFSSGISTARSSQHGRASHESSWTENPYVDIPLEKSRKETSQADLEPFDEDDVESNAEEDDSVNFTEPHRNSNVPSSSSTNPTMKSVSSVKSPSTKEHEKRRSIFSPPDEVSVRQLVKPQATVARRETAGSSKKVYDESYLQKMKQFMSNWTKEVQSGMHISKPVAPSKPAPIVLEKPKPKPKPIKKKEVCKYLADYHPPKRVKPKPYVTAKMYKFLENKLQPKFGLESRIQAEEFVVFLCETVTNVTKKKSNYHKLVFSLRDKMVDLGIIKTQLQFHVFIEDYLPDSFRVKSIPCLGCPKGPKLDTNDLNVDLSVK